MVVQVGRGAGRHNATEQPCTRPRRRHGARAPRRGQGRGPPQPRRGVRRVYSHKSWGRPCGFVGSNLVTVVP